MNFLTVKCPVYDRAGVAMLTGLINGMRELTDSFEVRALVTGPGYIKDAICMTYCDPENVKRAFRWADVILDIGGICRGFSTRRFSYIITAKKMNIPYVYMSQSFIDPDPSILDVDAIVARGPRSAAAVKKAIGHKIPIAVDLGFLVNPKHTLSTKNFAKDLTTGFTTYPNRDLSGMYKHIDKNSLQLIWKPDRDGVVFEPRLKNISTFTASVEKMFGIITRFKVMHTARYHAGVAAILGGVDLKLYPIEKSKSKYEDLLAFQSETPRQLRESALISCKVALEVARGNR